jgi:serine O-acetyltransferase
MIKDKQTLQLYLDADKFALGINRGFPRPFMDSIWRYERTLRYYEYHKNVGNKLRRFIYSLLLSIRGERLGFSISGNCFGPGLRINHHGLLIVNAKARIGKWCDVHQGVNIGEKGYLDEQGKVVSEVPALGDYCFIGPGAKIFGGCKIGDNVRIGANAIVNKDVPSHNTAFGNPMQTHMNKRGIITIATPSVEEEFLNKYPQYRELLTFS